MITLKGIPASPGIAIGPAYMVSSEGTSLEKKKIPSTNIEWEVRRYQEALRLTYDDLTKTQSNAQELFGKNFAKLMAAHKLILQDPLLVQGVIDKIKKEQINAEYALFLSVQEVNTAFEKIKDEFFRERKFDIADVAKRLYEHLTKKEQNKFALIKEPSVVIAHNLFPSDTINLKRKQVLGFATDIGGKTSHTALLAQTMQMPAVVGLSQATAQIKTGDLVILDGQEGLLIINPTTELIALYSKKKSQLEKEEKSLKTISDLPNETLDGHKVNLYVNYDPRRDFKELDTFRSDGLGLLRTEFLYMDRALPPDFEEQVSIYKKAALRFDTRPFTIRLADLGGDKIAQFRLAPHEQEANPFMGCRGIRLFLKYPSLMKTQMQAIIKTASLVPAKVKIMAPMISSAEEVIEVKKIFDQTLKEMQAHNICPQNKIDFGIMVEVPSIALTMDSVINKIDFASIGTNDLIQYLIAVDRGNQEVADLYDPYHPAVLRMISAIIQTCHKKKVEVSVCGEMASDPELVPFLVGLGIDSLSISTRMFLRIKNTLRNLNFEDCSNLAQAAILMGSSEEIRKLNEKHS